MGPQLVCANPWLCFGSVERFVDAPYLHNGSVPTLEDLLNPPMSMSTLQTLMDQAEQGPSSGSSIGYPGRIPRRGPRGNSFAKILSGLSRPSID